MTYRFLVGLLSRGRIQNTSIRSVEYFTCIASPLAATPGAGFACGLVRTASACTGIFKKRPHRQRAVRTPPVKLFAFLIKQFPTPPHTHTRSGGIVEKSGRNEPPATKNPNNRGNQERRVLSRVFLTQGVQAAKPPRSGSTGLPPADSCRGCASAAGADRKRSLGGGTDVDGSSDVAVVQHHHTCDRASPELVREGPITLAPYGTSAAAPAPGSLGSQKHIRGGTASAELGQEATMRDLSTPLASAGAGDVGAECDATPLQSRPPRSGSRSPGSFTLASLLRGGGGGAETASEEAASASGVESSNEEGRGALKRKDTITWESFLAKMSVGDGAKEDGRAKGAASSSDSSSPVENRLPREGSSEGPTTAPVSFFQVFVASFVCGCGCSSCVSRSSISVLSQASKYSPPSCLDDDSKVMCASVVRLFL